MKGQTDYKDVLHSAVATLVGGGTMLYPTDTIWGIGCDATNAAAVEKVYSIKQRDRSKSMLVLCEDLAMVEHFVSRVGGEAARLLLSEERPTTVILPVRSALLSSNLLAADGTVGVRIPRMAFCHEILQLFGRPVVSTSANLSGHPSPSCFADIERNLLERVDYCVPSCFERVGDGMGSRIVKVGPSGQVVVIRQ